MKLHSLEDLMPGKYVAMVYDLKWYIRSTDKKCNEPRLVCQLYALT